MQGASRRFTMALATLLLCSGMSESISHAHEIAIKIDAVDRSIFDIMSTVKTWQSQVIGNRGDDRTKDSLEIKVGAHAHRRSPYVTLTYAQSLDGCIAAFEEHHSEANDQHFASKERTSSNLPLSCGASLRLTHALRSVHDAVLVGGTTFAVDNPRLNIREWPPSGGLGNEGGKINDENESIRQPRPVVLDTELKSLLKLKLNSGAGSIRCQNPIICCAKNVAEQALNGEKGQLLSGVDVLPCERDPSGNGLDLNDVMRQLWAQRDIKSVMVEGGATILAAFANLDCVDCVCITLAPKLIGGRRGVNAMARFDGLSIEGKLSARNLDDRGAKFIPGIGSDCIFLSKWSC